MLLLKNGCIHDAVRPEAYAADILVEDGKIKAIGENLPGADEVIDLAGLSVYPGFVEAHCHLGLDGYGIGFEGADYNEYGDICTPQMRAIDSYNPLDPSVKKAALAGVTTVATGQGSSNAIGGTWIAVKTCGISADEAIVKDPVAMKGALGENPKRCYREKGNAARMSTASVIRGMLFKAKQYLAKKEAAGDDLSKEPAFDFKCEAMIPVLKKGDPLKAARAPGQRYPDGDPPGEGIRRGPDDRAYDRRPPDRGHPRERGLSPGRRSLAHTCLKIRASEQVLDDAGRPRRKRLPGLDHHRFPGDPAGVPAPVRRPCGEGGHGSV